MATGISYSDLLARARALLQESSRTFQMWSDVAPAASLVNDIDAFINGAPPAPVAFREHSVVLNRLAWEAATKLGRVSGGDSEYRGDPEELIRSAMSLGAGAQTSQPISALDTLVAESQAMGTYDAPAAALGRLTDEIRARRPLATDDQPLDVSKL